MRWLRPEYQARGELLLEGGRAHVAKPKPAKSAQPAGRPPRLADLSARPKAVESTLSYADRPQTAAGIAKPCSRARERDGAGILDPLVSLGRARPGDQPGAFVR